MVGKRVVYEPQKPYSPWTLTGIVGRTGVVLKEEYQGIAGKICTVKLDAPWAGPTVVVYAENLRRLED